MNKASSLIIPSSSLPLARLSERLGDAAPSELATLGTRDLLELPKTAFFCSARCPGSAILRAYDQVAHWRDAGRCVIGGFHSPVEKECLSILLRGTSPVIICPARGLPKRIPPEWESPLSEGRMLIVSIFPATQARVTATLATQRNDFVAALADEVWFAHITPGGETQRLHNLMASWIGSEK